MKRLLILLIITFCTNSNFAYYQAEQGRWISRDPVGEQGGVNVYGFVNNSSVNKIDSLGLKDFFAQNYDNNTYKDRFDSLSCVEKGLYDFINKGSFNKKHYNKEFQRQWDEVVTPAHEYFHKNYNDYNKFYYDDTVSWLGMNGINWGAIVPFTDPAIDTTHFLEDGTIGVIGTLLHEPQHDFSQRWLGHEGTWEEDLYLALYQAENIARSTTIAEECCEAAEPSWMVKSQWQKILCACGLDDE